MKRAFRTTWNGTASIVAAVTPGQARAVTLRSIVDAGYKKPDWKEIKCVRAPEYDGWAAVDETRGCWNEEYVPKDNGDHEKHRP